MQQLLQRTPGSLDVHSDWREDAYRLKVNLRQEVANRLGFTNASVARSLAASFEGVIVSTFWEGSRSVAAGKGRLVLLRPPAVKRTALPVKVPGTSLSSMPRTAI